MGGIQSHRVGFEALRDSIPGALVPEQDFELFYSKCKIETARTFSSALCPSHTQLFFVVVSGEVCVQLCTFDAKEAKNKVVTAATYVAGEVIHFFCAPTICSAPSSFEINDFGECLCNGDVKLALHFNSQKDSGRVIGMDQRSFEEFKASANGNLHNLISFLELNLASIVKTTNPFKAITAQQMYMYGLLLKVQLHAAGKIIDLKGRTPRSKKNPEAPDPPDCSPSPVGCTAMFIHGNGLSVPNSQNIRTVANKIVSADTWTSPIGVSRKQAKVVGFHFRAPPVLATGPGTPNILDFSDMPKPTASAERENSARGKKMVTITEGMVVGSDTYFTRTCPVDFRSYVTTSASVVGYIANDSIEALFEADPRFKRVFSRNYFSIVLSWIKFNVPFIMDMDDWSLALLSCKITLRGCNTDAVVKRKGDPSNYAYIVLGGSCKEISENAENNSVESERVIGWGGIVGEVCLTTNTPYFHTVVAREPTLLLALGKRVLDQIYYNNKAKLCEIRIRMMGVDVDLLHAIDHPIGSKLFNDFLTRQLAQENLAFYIAVERFDSMCKNLTKLYLQLLKMRARAWHVHAPDASTGARTAITNQHIHSEHPYQQRNHVITEDSAATSDLDKLKVFPIKVKPNSGGLVNPASGVYSAHRIAIHEIESDEELASEQSVRLNMAQSAKNEANAEAANNTVDGATNNKGLTLELSTTNVTTGLNTSGQNTGISGYSSKLSAGISDLSAYNINPTNDSSSDIHNHSAQNLKAEFHGMIDPAVIEGGLGASATNTAITPTEASKKRMHRSSFIRDKMESAQQGQRYSPKHLNVDVNATEGGSITLYSTMNDQTSRNSSGSIKMTPTSRALTNNPATPTSTEERTSLLQAIERNTDKVTKNIVELQLVAKHIMETFIFEGTCKQINLPGTMRMRAEKAFQQWTSSLAAGKTANKVEILVPPVQTDESSQENSFTLRSTPQNDEVTVHDTAKSDMAGAPVGEVVEAEETSLTIHANHNSNGVSMQTIPKHSNHNTTDPSTDNSTTPQYPLHATNDSAKEEEETETTDEPEKAVQMFMLRAHSVSVIRSVNGLPASDHTTILKSESSASGANSVPYKAESKQVYRSLFQVPTINPPTYSEDALRRINSGSSDANSPHSCLTFHQNPTVPTPTVISVEGIDMSFVDLFTESKAEILKLLRDDKFPRWKQTPEFHMFIQSIKPYDKDREHSRYTSAHFQSQNSSDKDRSIDSRSYRSKMS